MSTASTIATMRNIAAALEALAGEVDALEADALDVADSPAAGHTANVIRTVRHATATTSGALAQVEALAANRGPITPHYGGRS